MPCDDGVPLPEEMEDDPYAGLDISHAVRVLATHLNLSPDEAVFLEGHQDAFNAIDDYLDQYPNSENSYDFAKSAVGYLVDFPDTDVIELITNNNIPNANINLPILDTTELTNYPAFKTLVENLPSFLNNYPNVLKALAYTTGFSEKKIK